jgi:hypothetical protein
MTSYDAVARLDTPALRALLHAEAAHVRVWAAWALGLRLGAGARGELVAATRGEPDAGVRRHLLVVLAGERETDLLALLAREDPDGYVRAAACQLLGAVMPPGSPLVRAFALERLARDASSAVRLEALRLLGPVRDVDAEVGPVLAGLDDADLEVRTAALDALVHSTAHVRLEVRERLEREEDPGLRRRALEAWLDGAGAEAVLGALREAPVRRLQEVLELLVRVRRLRLPWEVLAPLAARGEPALDVWLVDLLAVEAAPEAARAWLLGLVARAAAEEPPRWGGAVQEAGSDARVPLLTVLQRAGALGEEERRLLPGVRAWFEKELQRAMRRPWDYVEPEETLEWALMRELARLA